MFSAKGKTSCLSREKQKEGTEKPFPLFSSDSGRLLGGAVEEGNDLRTQAVAVRGEGGVARAGGHARVDGPLHGGGVEGARAHIGKGARAHIGKGVCALSRRCAGRSPLEGDSLCARDGSIRGEGRAARAGGHVVFHRPSNGLFVIRAALHVSEGRGHGLRLGAAVGSPQEGDHLAARAARVRRKGRGGRAGGDVLRNGPLDGVGIVGVVGDIGKGKRRGAVIVLVAQDRGEEEVAEVRILVSLVDLMGEGVGKEDNVHAVFLVGKALHAAV